MLRVVAAAVGLWLSVVFAAPRASASLLQVSFAGSIDRIETPPGSQYYLFSLGQVGGTYTGTLTIDTDLLVPTTPGSYTLPSGAATLSLTLESIYTPPIPFPLIPTGAGAVLSLQTPPDHNWSVSTDTLSGNPGFGGPVRAQLEFVDDGTPGPLGDFVPTSLSGWSSARLNVQTAYQFSSQILFLTSTSGPLSQWSATAVPEPAATLPWISVLLLLGVRGVVAR